METLLKIVIVGYGFAGQIHAKTYRKLAASCYLAGIVECRQDRHPVIKKQHPGINIYETLELALANIGSDVIVDLCVPAPQHIELAKIAVTSGVTRIMLEKPLGWSYRMAVSLSEVLRGTDSIYLDTYLSSRGLSQLKSWVLREKSGIDKVCINFSKNRIEDSFNGRGFDNTTPPDAWHIEGPHMVTIALEIAGEISAIEEASLHDMTYNNKTISNHGGGYASIIHRGGTHTILSMDLRSRENFRIVEVFLKNKISFRLRLPKSKASTLSSHIERIEHGTVIESCTIEDYPMEQCISHGIDHFLTNSSNPISISHGIKISTILQTLTDVSMRSTCSTL